MMGRIKRRELDSIEQKKLQPKDDLSEAFWVRDQVFTIEQGFSPEIEIDAIDPLAHHVLFLADGQPVATARTFPKTLEDPEAEEGTYIVGRVCILKTHRGGGMGRRLMEAIEEVGRDAGAKRFELGAQCRAAGFYESCGYRQSDHHYFEEYCEHVTMTKEAGV